MIFGKKKPQCIRLGDSKLLIRMLLDAKKYVLKAYRQVTWGYFHVCIWVKKQMSQSIWTGYARSPAHMLLE